MLKPNSFNLSNLRIYNTALEQTRDNIKTLTKTNTNYIKSAVEQESVNRHNREANTSNYNNNIKWRQLGINNLLVYNLEILNYCT